MQVHKNQSAVPKVKASHRPKKRYILFSLSGVHGISFDGLKSFFNGFFRDFFREAFSEKMIWFVLFDFHSGKGIVRCRREALSDVKKAIESIRSFRGTSAKARVVLVSGTIRTLKEKLEQV